MSGKAKKRPSKSAAKTPNAETMTAERARELIDEQERQAIEATRDEIQEVLDRRGYVLVGMPGVRLEQGLIVPTADVVIRKASAV